MGINYEAALQVFLFTVGLGGVVGLLLLVSIYLARKEQAKELAAAIQEIETNG